MMRAGQLRHRVDLQSRAQTLSTASGDWTLTWTTTGVLWASVEPLIGQERDTAKQTNAELSHKVRMRWRSGMNSHYRILAPREATTLASATTSATGTSITISAALGPASGMGNFPIRIDSEDMLVTAGHGTTTLTVSRAQYGTTGATHDSGSAVEWLRPLDIEAVMDPMERNAELVILCKESE